MYLEYYSLKEKPFQISTDPKFLWLGEKHKEALSTLKYGILNNKGFLALTGDVGTGKTTLINCLLNDLEDDVIVATVFDPSLNRLDFFNYIASGFGLKEEFSSKGKFIARFSRFLNDAHSRNKKVLLLIDEAQRINDALLEEIRLLSNIEKQSTKLLNIFFVGQKEFNAVLLQPENRAVKQRITIKYNIDSLTLKETGIYIRHRLKVAGRTGEVFKRDSIASIYKYSGGIPRLINIVCDHALLTGYVRETKTIDSKIARECIEELRIDAETPVGGKVKAGTAEQTYDSESILKTKKLFERKPDPKISYGKMISYVMLFCLMVLFFLLIIVVGNKPEYLDLLKGAPKKENPVLYPIRNSDVHPPETPGNVPESDAQTSPKDGS